MQLCFKHVEDDSVAPCPRQGAPETESSHHPVIVSALRAPVLPGRGSPQRACRSVETFRLLPIRRYPHDHLLERIWELRRMLSCLGRSPQRSLARLRPAPGIRAPQARTHSSRQIVHQPRRANYPFLFIRVHPCPSVARAFIHPPLLTLRSRGTLALTVVPVNCSD